MVTTMNHEEAKIKHLEMIQDVISRMSINSFQIKSWAIMVLSALLALFASSANPLYILVSILSLLIFWIVDSMYLLQERKLITLYDKVADNDTSIKRYTIPLNKCYGGRCRYLNCMFSKTLLGLYLSCIILLIVFFLLLYFDVISFNII